MNKFIAIALLVLMASLPTLHTAQAESNAKVSAESLAEWLKKKKRAS